MLIDEIEKLRESLNRMVESENCSYEEIVRVSQELDCLIVEYLVGTRSQKTS